MRVHAIALTALLAANTLAAQNPPALDRLQATARTDSLDPQAHYQLGLGYLRDRQHDAADSAMRRAAQLDPRMAVARLGISVAQDRNRRYWDGLRRAGGDSAVTREKRNRDAELRRGFMLDPLVDIRVLAFADRERIDLPPDIASGNYAAASFYLQMLEGRLLADRRAGGVRDSLPLWLLWSHGLAAAHAGQPIHSILDLSVLVRRMVAIEASGDSVRAFPLPTNDVRYVLAAVHLRTGNRTQALATFRQVAEQDIGHYMAQVQMARAHEAGQEWSQAIQSWRGAIAANPEDHTLQLDLAASLTNGRFHARAESVLVSYASELERDPRYYYVLGCVRQALNNKAGALEAFRRYLELAPARWSGGIADARRRMQEIEASP